ncbi:MAG: hypothetical protein LAN71_04715 [Acidobacteriia bacterium]|nr:hypothetical protein [Terriglobia bacterium]
MIANKIWFCAVILGIALMGLLGGAEPLHAQATVQSGPVSKAKNEKGFTLIESFEASSNSYGQVMSFSSAAGYQFNKHFSLEVGVPVGFERATTTTSTTSGIPPVTTTTTSTTTYSGLGNAFLALHFAARTPLLNYASTITASAPTGDQSKGLTTGHVTADWTHTLSHDFDRLSPYLTAGIGNTTPNTRTFQRPYLTQGMLAHFEEGLMFDLSHSVSVGGLAYQIEPWGTQTLYSRTVPPISGAPKGPGQGPMSFMQNSVTTGSSSLTRDKGVGALLDYNPSPFIDLGIGFSHSVDLSVNTVSFGVTFNLSPLFRGKK